MIKMKISYIKVGFLKCNCYLLEKDNECLIIDPGDDYDQIKNKFGKKNIIGILLTHSHFDHVASVDNLVNDNNIEVYSLNNLKEGKNNIGKFHFEVIYTFGHSMDSITYYFYEDKMMFTGDFLFRDTIGRCDLLESNYNEMKKSIQKIKKYDDNIIVYPGHGMSSILGYEKKNNPYFNGID